MAIYVLIALATCAVFMFPWMQPINTYWAISLAAALLVETTAFVYVRLMLSAGQRASAQAPAYMAYGTILVLAGVAVIVHIVVFWKLLQVSILTYSLIQGITFLLLLALLIVVRVFAGYSQNQESSVRQHVQFIKQLQLQVLKMKQDLATWRYPEHEEIKSLLDKLEENLRYSDPVSHHQMFAREQHLVDQINLLADSVRLLPAAGDPGPALQHIRKLAWDTINGLELRNVELASLK